MHTHPNARLTPLRRDLWTAYNSSLDTVQAVTNLWRIARSMGAPLSTGGRVMKDLRPMLLRRYDCPRCQGSAQGGRAGLQMLRICAYVPFVL